VQLVCNLLRRFYHVLGVFFCNPRRLTNQLQNSGPLRRAGLCYLYLLVIAGSRFLLSLGLTFSPPSQTKQRRTRQWTRNSRLDLDDLAMMIKNAALPRTAR
jgi:hypothetical protein